MAETKKSSAAHLAGLLLGWCFIVALFVMIFYAAVYVQKETLGIYDIEKRLDRLENTIINKGAQNAR